MGGLSTDRQISKVYFNGCEETPYLFRKKINFFFLESWFKPGKKPSNPFSYSIFEPEKQVFL